MDAGIHRHYRQLVRAEPRFGPLVDEFGEVDPFRWPHSDEPAASKFGAMVFHSVGQQISMAGARAIYARLAALAGGDVRAEAIVELGPDQLRGVGLSGAKTRYIHSLAESQAAGRIDLEHMDDLTDADAMAQLTAQPGIGVWTAEMFLLLQLHRPDIFPVRDLGLRRAVQSLLRLPAEPAEKEALAISAPWSPNRSYATALLWSSRYPPAAKPEPATERELSGPLRGEPSDGR